MRKNAPAAFLLTGLLAFGAVFIATPAQADDDENEKSSSEVNQGPRPGDRKGEGFEHPKRKELEEKYGKEGRLSLPPLVIRPKRETDEVANLKNEEFEDGEAKNTDVSSAEKLSGPATAGSAPASGLDANVGSASAGFIAVNPAAKDSGVRIKTGTMVNLQQNSAIDLNNVKITKKTPADVFIQAAQVGLYAMAAGALALSVVAASRAIRRK